jgi:hypothetical protein
MFQIASFLLNEKMEYLAVKLPYMHPSKIILLLSFFMLTASGYSQDTPVLDDADTTKLIFEKVDIEAEFPGGDAAWRKYLEKNLNPNVPVDNGAPAGMYTIIVQFVVSRDGTVSDIKPLTKIGYGMEQEVIRILKKPGTWKPAVQHERPVNAYRKQPVIFMVEDESFSITTNVPYTLFTGTNNEITVDADKVKAENLQLTSPQATIIPAGDGKFTVRVNGKADRIVIELYNTKKKKTIGFASFEVKAAKGK